MFEKKKITNDLEYISALTERTLLSELTAEFSIRISKLNKTIKDYGNSTEAKQKETNKVL